MVDLIDIYDQMVIALRAEVDEATRPFFHPDFVVEEDFGLPYGGTYHGADGFIALRRKVKTYWNLAILSKNASRDGTSMVIVLKLTGVPEAPTAGMETIVSVIWTFRDGKAAAAKVLYFNTPPITEAIEGAKLAAAS